MFAWLPQTPATPPRPVALRAARITVIALGGGLALFLGFVCVLRLTGQVEQPTSIGTLLAYVSHGLAVMLLTPLFLVRSRFRAAIQRQAGEVKEHAEKDLVAPPVFSMTIISAALVEAPGLMAVVSLLIGAPWWAVGLPLLCILVIWLMAPSRATIRDAAR